MGSQSFARRLWQNATAHNGPLIVSQSDQIANAVNTMTHLVIKLRL